MRMKRTRHANFSKTQDSGTFRSLQVLVDAVTFTHRAVEVTCSFLFRDESIGDTRYEELDVVTKKAEPELAGSALGILYYELQPATGSSAEELR